MHTGVCVWAALSGWRRRDLLPRTTSRIRHAIHGRPAGILQWRRGDVRGRCRGHGASTKCVTAPAAQWRDPPRPGALLHGCCGCREGSLRRCCCRCVMLPPLWHVWVRQGFRTHYRQVQGHMRGCGGPPHQLPARPQSAPATRRTNTVSMATTALSGVHGARVVRTSPAHERHSDGE